MAVLGRLRLNSGAKSGGELLGRMAAPSQRYLSKTASTLPPSSTDTVRC